jgi:hypothetical protein
MSELTKTNENIGFFLSETEEYNNNRTTTNLDDILNQFYGDEYNNNDTQILMDDLNLCLLVDYNENNTTKQLLHICDYYKITKEYKLIKAKKIDIINAIMIFENDDANKEIVMKRKQLWYYIQELKSDKYMKQFIFWN